MQKYFYDTVPCSLFPVPCSLFPTSERSLVYQGNLLPSQEKNCPLSP
ncbi:MAG: hypothetical protein F6K26_01550 [Moorea sp. SIO2I5]|nr:hypothetical protein [Moorena sp. SIO2I5]